VTINVEDNGGYVFDHWGNGSTARTLVLTPIQATNLIAYSRTSVTNASVVTVHTVEPDGIPVTGLWTTATLDGQVVASGYTPFTFVATKGDNYSLTVANFQSYSFSSWANGTADVRAQNITITPTQNLLLDAYVLNGSAQGKSAVPKPLQGPTPVLSSQAPSSHLFPRESSLSVSSQRPRPRSAG